MIRVGTPGLALVLLALGCNAPAVEADPVYTSPMAIDDVDDRLSHLVTGDRHRVVYGPGDPIRGAAEPLVTFVVWSDFQCPFCGQFASTLDELVRAYPDDVRIVSKQFPLPIHAQANGAARAVIAAHAQGRFWAMHDRLFAHQGTLREDALPEHAQAIGLDVEAFTAALTSEDTKRRLEHEITAGRELGVRGTPSFFTNGLFFSGATDPALLALLVERERAAADRLIAAGSSRAEVYARIMRAAKPAGAPSPASPPPPAEP